MELLTIQNYQVAKFPDVENPYISDLELGKKLQFERPRKIRELIKRHIKNGNLRDYKVCPTVGQTPFDAGLGGRPEKTYYLSEPDSLFIVTKSDTPVANQITREIIQVFMAWRRGFSNDNLQILQELQEVKSEFQIFKNEAIQKLENILSEVYELKAYQQKFLPDNIPSDPLEKLQEGQEIISLEQLFLKGLEICFREQHCQIYRLNNWNKSSTLIGFLSNKGTHLYLYPKATIQTLCEAAFDFNGTMILGRKLTRLGFFEGCQKYDPVSGNRLYVWKIEKSKITFLN